MPTEEENIQYLYLVLTHAGPPQINWPPICTALSLSAGTTSKRWSRLRTALEAGKPAGKGAYELLWLCAKHSGRDKAPDWHAIAAACGTTPGAASKRYSRMKQAWDKDGAGAGASAGANTTASPPNASLPPTTPKRKRAPANPKTTAPEHEHEHDTEHDLEASPKKRARPAPKEAQSKSEFKSNSSKKHPTTKLHPSAPLPTPAPSSDQHHAFRGFAPAREPHAFRGFRQGVDADEGADADADADADAEAEEWYESREYLLEGGVQQRVSGWLEEI